MSEHLSHLDAAGRARMVDIGDKPVTAREAIARGRIRMAAVTLQRAISGKTPKGDIRAIAEIAGVMAGKRTAELIPLCHSLSLTSLKVEIDPDETNACFVVTAHAKTIAQSGVEMEALVAVSVACLTIYDMLKAIDRSMVIDDVTLLAKTGGANGNYIRETP